MSSYKKWSWKQKSESSPFLLSTFTVGPNNHALSSGESCLLLFRLNNLDMLISYTRLVIWTHSWEIWVCIWVWHSLFPSAAYYAKGAGIIRYQNHHRSVFLCRTAELCVQSRWRSLHTRCTPDSTVSKKTVLESWQVGWGCSHNWLFMSTEVWPWIPYVGQITESNNG